MPCWSDLTFMTTSFDAPPIPATPLASDAVNATANTAAGAGGIDGLAAVPAPATPARPRNEYPVRAVGDERLRVTTANGTGVVPLYRAEPAAKDAADAAGALAVTRAVIVLHGRLRDADAYLASAEGALRAAGAEAAGTALLVPQFLATADIATHHLPADVLHWEWTSWMSGEDAIGPAPISSFDVLDALIAYCTEDGRYPHLREIVIAGHSGGAQVAHRYAVVGQASALCASRGLACRFVIANPSSYVYFDAQRPQPEGGFREADMRECPHANDWRYGIHHAPRYARDAAFDVLEQHYLRSDITYLLGDRDCDPEHQALDRSCAAQLQGPHRLARGRAYFAYLKTRDPHLTQTCHEIAGVGHNGDAMLGSPEGVYALFRVKIAARAASAATSSGASE
jgi:hypothetical protein